MKTRDQKSDFTLLITGQKLMSLQTITDERKTRWR